MSYTTQPSTDWPGYVDIFEDGQRRGGCPADQAEQELTRRENSTRDFWQRIVNRAADPRSFVANGHSYWIGESTDYPKGFGGRRWRITFLDGRIVECDSLWHQGEIPAEWRERLPDNAALRNLDSVPHYCPQCQRQASAFFNELCARCAGGHL